MKFLFRAVLAALLSLAPSFASACTVCFGGADGDLRKGFTWGVLILLTLPFAMAAGFITVIARTVRKKKAQ